MVNSTDTRGQGRKIRCQLSVVAGIAIAFVSTAAGAATPLVFLVTGNTATGRPVIEGTTNLPDGAELMVTLSRKANSYMAQDTLKVQGGRFKSNQFTNRFSPLLPGQYVLEVSGPITAVQPAASALGDNYSNYSGPLLKRGKYGTTLRYETTLVIPGQSNSAADAAARKAAEEDKAAWLRRSCTEIPEISERLTGKRMTRSDRDAAVKECLAGIK
jgi:hypothetical protein